MDEDGNLEVYSPGVNATEGQIWITSEYFKKPGDYLVKLRIPTIFDYDLELGKKIKLIW